MDEEFIVIGQRDKIFHPRILQRVANEGRARLFAREHFKRTQLDTTIFNLKTGLCVLALTDEPPEA